MSDMNCIKSTKAEEESCLKEIIKRINKLERSHHKKKKYKDIEMKKRIKKIIEEEVSKA